MIMIILCIPTGEGLVFSADPVSVGTLLARYRTNEQYEYGSHGVVRYHTYVPFVPHVPN